MSYQQISKGNGYSVDCKPLDQKRIKVISAIANDFGRKLWFTLKFKNQKDFFPLNLEFAAEQILGLEVREEVFLDKHQLGEYCPSHKVIRLNSLVKAARRLYSLAHEIGHALLHDTQVPNEVKSYRRTASEMPQDLRLDIYTRLRKYNITNSQKSVSSSLFNIEQRKQIKYFERPMIEREADRFASELLMPERAIKKQFLWQFGDSTEIFKNPRIAFYLMKDAVGVNEPSVFWRQNAFNRAIAFAKAKNFDNKIFPPLYSSFGVSPSAMAFRLIELNLVNEAREKLKS